MLHRSLLFFMIFAPITCFTGCGSDSGTRVLDGEVRVDPDVGADVNDPDAMAAFDKVDPTAPK